MSKRFVGGLVVVLAATLPVASVLGQTTVTTGKANVTLSGKLDLTWAYRSGEYFTATKGDGVAGNPGSFPYVDPGLSNAERVSGVTVPAGVPRSHASEFYLDPYLDLKFAIEVEKQIRGVADLRTPFVNPDAGGKNTSPGTGFFSGFQNRTLEAKQLYIEVSELLRPSETEPGSGLLLRGGIQDFRKSLRNDPNAFVIIDTAGSEHPFDSFPTGSPTRYSAGFADSTEAAGGYARYRVSVLDVDGWLFNLDESYNALSIGAANRRNLYFYGGSADLYFDTERKKWGKAFLTVFDLMPESSSHVVTEGGGVTVKPIHYEDLDPLEIYGEIYFQQGTYAKNVILPGLGSSRIKQEDAYALDIGAMGKLPGLSLADRKWVPYLELSYVQVSGDDNSVDRHNSNFVSLENTNSTLVVENGYYGLDIDANYRGPRLRVGSTIGKVQIEALYAYFELMENGGDRISGGGTSGIPSSSNKLGDEIDASIGYEYSANLHLKLSTGWLLDSKALGQSAAMNVTLAQVQLDF